MTHSEALDQMADAMRYVSKDLANNRGVVRIVMEVEFYRDPETGKLTNVPQRRELKIQ